MVEVLYILMHRSLLLATSLAVILLPEILPAAAKKPPALTVSFHLQAEPGDRRAFKQLTAGKEVLFRKSPEIATSDIVAFRSFPADDGNSYGVIFQLSKVASGRLSSLSTANRGKLLLAVVNGQVRDAVLIDKQVNDGLLVIWKWVSLAEVRLADQHLPRIGEDPKDWKKRLREEKKKK